MDNTRKKYLVISISVLIIIGLILLAALIYNKNSQNRIATIPPVENMSELSPGNTNLKEATKTLGNPLTRIEENGYEKLSYKSSRKLDHHEVYTKENIVEFAKELKNVTQPDLYFKDVQAQYGEPEFTLYKKNVTPTHRLYIYLSRGLAYWTNPTGPVYEVWYFIPTDLETFLDTWGKDYTTEEPTNVQ